MLSDMLWAGSLDHRIITSGGRIANPTRTVQLESELTFPARPAAHTAEIQAPANVSFLYLNCILKMYEPSPNGAVPECTPVLSDDCSLSRSRRINRLQGGCAFLQRDRTAG
jgi:hypothetical protein